MKNLTFMTLLLLLFSTNVTAEIVVLIHGFDSNSHTWQRQGVTHQLEQQGWQNAGTLSLRDNPNGDYYNHPQELKPYRFVAVELPSEATLTIQADILRKYLNYIHNVSPEQKLTLIGHSAGGVVARLAIVQQPSLPVKRLITIASPHLGSGMAEVGELAAKSPISLITPLLGAGIINRSELLFNQLQREEPGSFLFGLNRQAHPNIDYIAIIRTDGSWFDKDFFVHAYSQNLNHVAAISNAHSFYNKGTHELQYGDGLLISRLLNKSPNE